MSEGLTMNQLAERNALLVTENAALKQKLDARGLTLDERAELIHTYSKVQCEFAEELNCDSDNESILMAIHNLQQQVNILAAENLLARNAVQTFCDVIGDKTDVICDKIGFAGVMSVLAAMKAVGEMPVTDAYLNSARAEGVEMFSLYLAETAIKEGAELDDWKSAASNEAFDYATQLRANQEAK